MYIHIDIEATELSLDDLLWWLCGSCYWLAANTQERLRYWLAANTRNCLGYVLTCVVRIRLGFFDKLQIYIVIDMCKVFGVIDIYISMVSLIKMLGIIEQYGIGGHVVDRFVVDLSQGFV